MLGRRPPHPPSLKEHTLPQPHVKANLSSQRRFQHIPCPRESPLSQVIGWSVRSNFDRVEGGAGRHAAGLNELRPINAIMPYLVRLLEASSRPSAQLEGAMPSCSSVPRLARRAPLHKMLLTRQQRRTVLPAPPPPPRRTPWPRRRMC